MAGDNVQTATDGNFDSEVLKSDQPALVDFWAEWCGPCRALAPTIDALATEYSGKLKVYKLNVDENPGVAAKFGVRSIPTVMFFKDGKAVTQVIGNQPKTSFVEAIKKLT